MVEHSVVVMAASFQSRRSQINHVVAIFYSRFMKFVFRISGGIKFWNLVEDSYPGVRVQLPLG